MVILEPSENELIGRSISGCAISFTELLNQYSAPIYNLAMYLTSSPKESERLLEEIFVEIYEKLSSYDEKTEKFSCWVYRVAMEVSVRNLSESMFSWEYPSYSSALHIESMFQSEPPCFKTCLNKAIRKLPLEYKAIYYFREISGISQAEVSSITSVPVTEINKRLSLARRMLRENLREEMQNQLGQNVFNEVKAEAVSVELEHSC